MLHGADEHDQLVVTSFDGTASYTIDVTVTGTNDAATITASASEDTAVIEAGDGNATVLATAGDPSASGQLTVHDVDDGENHFATPASLAGTYGTFTFNPTTGVWGYTLANGQTNVQELNAGDVVHGRRFHARYSEGPLWHRHRREPDLRQRRNDLRLCAEYDRLQDLGGRNIAIE